MCLTPITIKVQSIYHNGRLQVPCGKCVECLRRYQNDWLCRIYYESQLHSKICFVTLTYSDDHVPYVVNSDTGETANSLCKKHLQLWFKRIRRLSGYYNKPLEFRYFACGEYGPTTLRPHYHLLFFGVDYKDLLPFLKLWEQDYGFFNCKDVQYTSDSLIKTSAYVSKYCSKGVFENPKVSQIGIEKPFRLASKGLGKNYIDLLKVHHLTSTSFNRKQYFDDIINKAFVVLPNGFSYSMPRYYKNKIYGEKSLLSFKMFLASQKKFDDLCVQQLEQLQAQNQNWSPVETIRFYCLRNITDSQNKGYRQFKQLADFYQQSKI